MRQRSFIISIVFSFIGLSALGFIVKNLVSNPMDSRRESLESDLENLETRPIFYIAPPQIDYAELDAQLDGRPKLWQELIPPAAKKKVMPRGPDFRKVLRGVVVSKRREMKLGDTLKVHVTTPARPNGYWVQVGDEINKSKIIEITPTHVVFERRPKPFRFTYRLPRK